MAAMQVEIYRPLTCAVSETQQCADTNAVLVSPLTERVQIITEAKPSGRILYCILYLSFRASQVYNI